MSTPLSTLIHSQLEPWLGLAASWPAWRAARAGDGAAPWPCLHVSLDLTYRCNLRCAMCFLHGRHLDGDNPRTAERRALRELDADQWCEVISDLRTTGVGSLVVTGGEVMLKRRFLDILEHAVGLGMSVSVLSNGTLWSPEAVDRLVEIGPALVRFSLDGNAVIHDEICRAPAFSRLAQTLRLIRDAKRRRMTTSTPRVAFETILQRANESSLREVVETAAEFGVDEVLVSNIFFLPHANGNGGAHGQTTRQVDAALYDVDSAAAAAELAAARRVGERRGVRVVSRLRSEDDIAAIYRDPGYAFVDKCFYPWMVARIDPFGRVIPCTGSRLPLGNVRERSLRKIWNDAPYRALRRELGAARLFPECAKCNTLAGGRWASWNWLPAGRAAAVPEP